MLLWVILAAITAVVLSFLLYPLVSQRVGEEERDAFNAAVYKDQLDEIDADLKRGQIGEAEAEAARLEVARRLLASDERRKNEAGGTSHSVLANASFIVVAIGLPLAVLGTYLFYGAPSLPDQPLAARLTDPADENDVGVLVARVEARLRAYPDEGEGWDAIAPIYLGAGRYEDAGEAYRQAIRLLGPTAKRLSGLGQAIVYEQQGLVTEPARLALVEALKYDDTLLEPRIILTKAKEQDGDFEGAVVDWQDLLKRRPDDERWQMMITQRIAEAKAQAAGEPVAETPAPQPGPSAADMAAAQNMTPAERQDMVNQMVARLADRLQTNGNDLPGWLRLVRAYTVLGKSGEARSALDKARAQFAGNAKAIEALDTLADELGLKS